MIKYLKYLKRFLNLLIGDLNVFSLIFTESINNRESLGFLMFKYTKQIPLKNV